MRAVRPPGLLTVDGSGNGIRSSFTGQVTPVPAGARLELRMQIQTYGLLRTALRCNNAHLERDGDRWRRSGDPTESALLVAAAQLDSDFPGSSSSVVIRFRCGSK